jgi:hypothetical protein
MAEERMTLIERLRNPAYQIEEGGYGGTARARLVEKDVLVDMTLAADEIERLQRLVGVGSLKPGEFPAKEREQRIVDSLMAAAQALAEDCIARDPQNAQLYRDRPNSYGSIKPEE